MSTANHGTASQREGTDKSTIFIAIASGASIDRVFEVDVRGTEPCVRSSSVREILLRIDGVDLAAPVGAAPAHGGLSSVARKRVCGRLTIDYDEHRALLGSTPIHLTAMEMRLLTYLVERQGCLCRHQDILSCVWRTVGDTSKRTLNTHVNRLRTKLAGAGVCLETVRGVGLRITEAAAVPEAAPARTSARGSHKQVMAGKVMRVVQAVG